MEGYSLKRRVQELLAENVGGSFVDDRTTYDYIYDAVQDFNKRTHYLTNTQTISVPGDSATRSFNLNPDYVSMALVDQYDQPYIKYTTTSDTFVFGQDYSNYILNNNSSVANVINYFSVIDSAQLSPISGSATSIGNASNGECILTDSAAPFTNVASGDFVHNLTDLSHGVIINVISTSQVTCCLFEGSANQWGNNDSYIIVPQSRFTIYFDPIPSLAATATIIYTCKPTPVYSAYKAYKLPNDAMLPISQFAVFLYKYRDREPQFGDALYKHYDLFTRRVAAEMRRSIPEKSGMKVNLIKMNRRSTGSGQWR